MVGLMKTHVCENPLGGGTALLWQRSAFSEYLLKWVREFWTNMDDCLDPVKADGISRNHSDYSSIHSSHALSLNDKGGRRTRRVKT